MVEIVHPWQAATSVCAISAWYKIPTFTPELRGELSSPINFKGRGLVQCVSNGVCIWPLTFKLLIASHPLGLSASYLCRQVKKKLSHPTQLSAPKTVEWLGRYAQFRGIGPICPGRGGGAWGRPFIRFSPTLLITQLHCSALSTYATHCHSVPHFSFVCSGTHLSLILICNADSGRLLFFSPIPYFSLAPTLVWLLPFLTNNHCSRSSFNSLQSSQIACHVLSLLLSRV